MSFNIPRDSNKKIIKKATAVNTSPTLSQTSSLGTTGQTSFASLTSLTLNGISVTSSAIQLNSLKKAIPGTAVPSTPIIMDNDKNITGINSMSCNSLSVNGVNITASMFSSAVSNDSANVYLTNMVPGIAKASKALITDVNNKVSNINSVSASALAINGVDIINSNSKTANLNNLYDSDYIYNSDLTDLNLTAQYAQSTTASVNYYMVNTFWSSVCWSSELQLYVSVCNGGGGITLTNERVMTSPDGINWTLRSIPFNNNYSSVCWSPKLKMFVAVGSGTIIYSSDGINWLSTTGGGISVCWSPELNLFACAYYSSIMTSPDGINWTNRSVPLGVQTSSICWSPELNIFVCVATSAPAGVNGRVVTSTNGINWSLIQDPGLNYYWTSVCWSPELGIFVAIGSNSPSCMISSDGANWVLYDIILDLRPSCICWASDLKLFISYDGSYILYSPNGYMWYKNNTNALNFQCSSIIWNSDLKQFVGVSGSNTNSYPRVIVSNPIMPSISNPKDTVISFSKTNKYVGINSTAPNKPLEINSPDGKCFKHYSYYYPSKFITYDILSTGQFNITAQKYFSLTASPSSYGLMLNNELINTSPSEFNTYLSNNVAGTAEASKILILDSNSNISGINMLNCNSLIVNGNTLSTSNNHQYVINSAIGSAAASSAIIADINNNFLGINQLSINKLKINNSKIFNSTDINLSEINDRNKYSKDLIHYNLQNLNTRSGQLGDINCSAYSPELKIFVAGYSSGTRRIAYSTNGTNWIFINDLYINNYSVTAICWSSELMLFVASASQYLCYSNNGINWQVSNNQAQNTFDSFNSICWSPELMIFVAVANTNGHRVSVSRDGYNWFKSATYYNYTWRTVCWCNKLGLFIAGAEESENTNLMSSPDGINWNKINTNYIRSIRSIDWSEDLNMVVAACSNGLFLYSYDGIVWNTSNNHAGYNWQNIKWIQELRIFLVVASGSINMAYSYDGINWYYIINNISRAIVNSNIIWSPELSSIVITTNDIFSDSTFIMISQPFKKISLNNNLKSQSNEFVFDNINGRLGLGVSSPSYQLHLSSDSAAKPSTSTWTVSSDERLKENIQSADLDLCYSNIKNLRLAKYTWKDDVYTSDQVADRSKLGWIAQEVETVFPKAVEKHNLHGYEDCRTLNTDQIIASMYGCAKKIIEKFTNDEEKFNILSNKLQTLETFLNSLPEE